MKKLVTLFMALILALGLCTLAETDETFFTQLEGLEWSFSSGAGAWSTDMRIRSDGSFSGEYHDSEMGESGKDYPYGTIYCCSFSGRLRLQEKVGENSWKVRIEELKPDESQEAEVIEEGIRFVAAVPYGLSEGDEMILFCPGTPLEELTEDMLMWAHQLGQENVTGELQNWFLYSEKNESGFVGERFDDML